MLLQNLLKLGRHIGLAGLSIVVMSDGLNAQSSMSNPIGRVARLFNPRLVKVEERVEFLNNQLMSLALHQEQSLKTGIGCRGARISPGGPDPSVVIDLGKVVPVEALYLVPLQEESSERRGLFPKRFTIEFSIVPDFSKKRILYTSGDKYFPGSGGKPVKFMGQGAQARYVKLIVNQGQMRGESEVFGLSEFVVISDGFPVSFGSKVSAEGQLCDKDLWYAGAITDGRMPLGVWQGGNWSGKDEKSNLYSIASPDEEISWSINFGKDTKLDMVVLFPYEIRGVLEAGILPEKMEFQVRAEGEADFKTIRLWENPVEGTNHVTPLLLPLNGIVASEFRIKGLKARVVGNEQLYGFSEIEVWSDHKNIAKDHTVSCKASDMSTPVATLTNGYASERQIIPVGSWLNQLHERWRVEREIEALQPMHTQMAAESELNATWGSAMMLGLTFLIPVFVVERRRLISSKHIDQLRKRIAADLHDDIGSNLGSISLIARTARKDLVRLHGPDEIAEDLDEVESIARESSLAMRDIVWLLERKQDSIGDLVHRMRETASRLLREMDYTIECDSSKSAAKLSLDAKRHLFLFYKEAIHNVLKHAKAKKVTIRLWDKGDMLALQIIDDGKGLPMVMENDFEVPHLVRKLDDRARVLDGKLEVKTEAFKGTEILLTVKHSLLIAISSSK
ncbi:MAG: hypothetical protein H7Y36_09590 [Armatimonadetes bacterium]|nr:hypothetical protein [Akkermansiaceae bacterium]